MAQGFGTAADLERIEEGSDTPISGDFHAMVANDGPHYGDNVKLQGPGKYTLTFSVLPHSYMAFAVK